MLNHYNKKMHYPHDTADNLWVVPEWCSAGAVGIVSLLMLVNCGLDPLPATNNREPEPPTTNPKDNGQSCAANSECSKTCIGSVCANQGATNAACDAGDDDDCSTGRICESGSNVCRCDGNSCTEDNGQQCSTNAECTNTCINSICANPATANESCDTGQNDDCAENHICDGASNTCLKDNGQGCQNNTQCSNTCISEICADPANTNEVCDAGQNDDCAGNHTCDAASSTCLKDNGQGCQNNPQCSNTCISEICADPASANESCDTGQNDDCAENHICDDSTDTCLKNNGQGCQNNTQCSNTCISEICADPANTNEVCDAGQNDDCAGNHTCDGASNTCLKDNVQVCGANTECANTCLTGICSAQVSTNAACDDNDSDDCAAGHSCEPTSDTCLKDHGQSCTAASECTNTCVATICVDPPSTGDACDESNDCPSGHLCAGSICAKENGQSCATDSECLNTCVGNSCGDLVYVDVDATAGLNDGTSWASAFLSLQDALMSVTDDSTTTPGSPLEIWVAEGTYYPTTSCPGGTCSTGTTDTTSFVLVSNVGIYGGFSGVESALDDRNVSANLTILSGDIDKNGVHNGSNSEHVVYANAAGSSAILDGVTISGGYANTNNLTANGGGIYLATSAPILKNLIIKKNLATGKGGGMYNDASSPSISNTTFGDNIGYFGAGMYSWNDSNPEVIGSIFVNNTTTGANNQRHGGAILQSTGSLSLTRTIVASNSAVRYGGGIELQNSNAILTEVVVCGNFTMQGDDNGNGGGIYKNGGTLRIVNSAIIGNYARTAGGIRVLNYDPVELINVTIAGNYSWNSGSAAIERGDPSIKNSIFWDNIGTSGDAQGSTPINTAIVTNSSIEGGYTPGTTGEAIDVTSLSTTPFASPPAGGIWTDTPTYNSTTFQTTLYRSIASWTPDELKGKYLEPDTSDHKKFLIASNGVTSVTIWGDVTGDVDGNETYAFFDYQLASDSPALDAGNNEVRLSGTGLCSDEETICIYESATTDLAGETRCVDNAVTDTGTAGSSGLPIIDQGAFEKQ
jgi:hypothetical protein